MTALHAALSRQPVPMEAVTRELLVVDPGVADAGGLLDGLARPMEILHLLPGDPLG